MIMVAVRHFDVHSHFGHFASNLAKLTGFPLIQSLHYDFPLFENAYPRGLERFAGSRAIREEKVRNPRAL
jgi:hypothetical protein